MDAQRQFNILLAAIFAAGTATSRDHLLSSYDISAEDLDASLGKIRDFLNGTSLSLHEYAGKLTIITLPEYGEYLRKMIPNEPRRRPLSDAALETFAVIVAKRPCTKDDIEQVRGVDCEKALNTLQDAGLIKQIARLAEPGAPILYALTEACLFHFGMTSFKELDDLIMEKLERLGVAY